APGRTGKRRLRADIRVDSTKSSPRPRFFLEAKRLNHTHPVRDYLGPEGLGAFLTGEYAGVYPTAGMLGYVQKGKLDDCAAEITRELSDNPSQYQVSKGGVLTPDVIPGGFDSTYRSEHD